MTVLQSPVERIRFDEIRVRARVWPEGAKFWSVDGYRRGRLLQHFGFWSDIGEASHNAYGFAQEHGVHSVQIVGKAECHG